MKVLLHICCGPCSIYPVRVLREQGHDVYGYFYNPNIHPYQEYDRRKQTLIEYARSIELPLIFPKANQEYDLESYLRQVVFRESERCRFCYHHRLGAAAKTARAGKFDAFTSTLLYSKFQKHELIAQTGQAEAGSGRVKFLYQDFREGWKEGVEKSRELGLYRQQYCGCIYSEKERYSPGIGYKKDAHPQG